MKPLAEGKSRLARQLTRDQRAELTVGMLRRVISAIRGDSQGGGVLSASQRGQGGGVLGVAPKVQLQPPGPLASSQVSPKSSK